MGSKSYCGNYTEEFISELIQMEVNLSKAKSCGEYIDPDGTYTDENSDYYRKLKEFLNQQENILDEEKRWTYEFRHDYPQCIEATKDNMHIVYLRSDQFGFSVPKLYNGALNACDERYPYWNYLMNTNDKEKVENVNKWVRTSRTIGGSFIWPIWKNGDGFSSIYNRYRGVGSYIEDSVDLTLFEVKNYYTWKNNGGKDIDNYLYKNDVLWKSELIKKESKMREWLDHFGDFNTFIDYFLLKDFVVEQDNEYSPKDITTEMELTPELVKKYREAYKQKNKREINGRIMDMQPADLEKMLNWLAGCIVNRSNKIINGDSYST